MSARGFIRGFWLFAALGLALGLEARAANKNVGTSGAQFLKIGAGARPTGMGEAFTAVADDVNAVVWNPAGLGKMESPQFTAMHTQWLQQADYNFAAAAYPLPFGTIGVGFNSLAVDNIEKRLGDTDAPDGTFDSMDANYTLAYGKSIGDSWQAGLGAGFIRQQIDGKSASAFSGSAGVLWRTPHRPLTLGLSMKNMGSSLKFVEEADPLPLTGTIGLGYKVLGDRLTIATDARWQRDNDMQYGAGLELRQPFAWGLTGALRTGYNTAGTDPTDGFTGVSAGVGLAWRQWAFDAAWVPYGVLGNTFRYAFLVKF